MKFDSKMYLEMENSNNLIGSHTQIGVKTILGGISFSLPIFACKEEKSNFCILIS